MCLLVQLSQLSVFVKLYTHGIISGLFIGVAQTYASFSPCHHWWYKLAQMKGTEVPNPRRSSACDSTCVLTRNRSLTLSCLRMCIVLFLPMQKFAVSDALSQALCNLSWAFLGGFTLSDSIAPIRFIVKLFLSQITLCFSFESKDKITAFTCLPSYRYSSFTLRAYLC